MQPPYKEAFCLIDRHFALWSNPKMAANPETVNSV